VGFWQNFEEPPCPPTPGCEQMGRGAEKTRHVASAPLEAGGVPFSMLPLRVLGEMVACRHLEVPEFLCTVEKFA